MLQPPTPKNQHYVWRHHLDAWTANDGIACYRQADRHGFRTNPKNIASETYFYRVFDLTEAEAKYLDLVIAGRPNYWTQVTCRNFVNLFTHGGKLRRQLDDPGLDEKLRAEIKKQVEYIENSICEQYHVAVEQAGQPLLARLRAGDATFWDNENDACAFTHFIATQYLRTARMRDAIIDIPLPPDVDLARVWPIEHHFRTIEIGAALFDARDRYRAIILKNTSPIHFITGDQPVINLNPTGVLDMKLYYPVTPTCALLLTTDPVEQPRSVSELEARRLNLEIYRWSRDQLYGVDLDYLKAVGVLDKIPLS